MNPLGRFALPCAAAYIDGLAPRLNPQTPARRRTNGMKTKTFTGNAPAAVIKAVNDWLAAETGVTIRHTQTREDAVDPDTGAPMIRLEIQYEQTP